MDRNVCAAVRAAEEVGRVTGARAAAERLERETARGRALAASAAAARRRVPLPASTWPSVSSYMDPCVGHSAPSSAISSATSVLEFSSAPNYVRPTRQPGGPPNMVSENETLFPSDESFDAHLREICDNLDAEVDAAESKKAAAAARAEKLRLAAENRAAKVAKRRRLHLMSDSGRYVLFCGFCAAGYIFLLLSEC